MKKILYLTDLTDRSLQALKFVAQFGSVVGSEITVAQIKKRNNKPNEQFQSILHQLFPDFPDHLSLLLTAPLSRKKIINISQPYDLISLCKTNYIKLTAGKSDFKPENVNCPIFILPVNPEYLGIRNILISGYRYKNLPVHVRQNVRSLNRSFATGIHCLSLSTSPGKWFYNKELFHNKRYLVEQSLDKKEKFAQYIVDNRIDLLVCLQENKDPLYKFLLNDSIVHSSIPMLLFPERVKNNQKLQEDRLKPPSSQLLAS